MTGSLEHIVHTGNQVKKKLVTAKIAFCNLRSTSAPAPKHDAKHKHRRRTASNSIYHAKEPELLQAAADGANLCI